MTEAENGGAEAVGLATFVAGEPIEVFFPEPRLGGLGDTGWEELEEGAPEVAQFEGMLGEDPVLAVRRAPVFVRIADLAAAPQSVPDAYLRLHLLSHRIVPPRGLNVDGLLGLLPNIAWTDAGPVPAADLNSARLRAMAKGLRLRVRSVDKVPRMVDYVVPSGVRIGDADR